MAEEKQAKGGDLERIVIYPNDYDIDTQSELFMFLRKRGVRFSSLKYL